MNENDYVKLVSKVGQRENVYLTLCGYFAYTHSTDIHVQSAKDAVKLTNFLFDESDNPFFWLMTVLCTRELDVDEIIQALRENGATD